MSERDENDKNNRDSIKSNEENAPREEEEEEENEKKKEDEENNEKEEKGENDEKNELPSEKKPSIPFIYLEEVINENLKNNDEEQLFINYKGKYKYSFCILMENNELIDSIFLQQSLLSIGKNLKKLNEDINIEAQDICIFIFINEIKNNNNILKIENLENEYEEKNKEFNIREWKMLCEKEDMKDLEKIQIFTINKLKYLYPIKSLIFYYKILSQIKIIKKIIFSTIITAGVTFDQNKLFELISYAYHDAKKHGIAISSTDFKEDNLVSKLCTYEKKRFNIYNMSYMNESNIAPISSQLSTITINDKILRLLNDYYEKFKTNIKAKIDYHDYNLALYLKQNDILIKYILDNPGYVTTSEEFSFYDYQQIYIDRFSGYYGNFFQILSSFKSCTILQVPFLIFQIISMCSEFIMPSIVSMIIYIIFYAAFKTDDFRISLFLSLLYLTLMFISGYCSLVGKDINKMKNTYLIINILMTLLYFLSLISSIPAMHFANKNKNPDLSGYKFNKAAISTIIILTFIPYIIPIILNNSYLKGDAFLLLIYNLVFAPLFKINFNVAGILGASDASGGKTVKERKSLLVLFYLGINLFIGSLSFYNFDNKKKANCVMGFGIIYLVYNFIRSLAIVLEICFKKEETFTNQSLLNNIKDDLEGKEERKDSHDEEQNTQIKEDENQNNINNEQNDEDGREVEIKHDD